ncbi:MAG: redoxin domain-containing protein [Candidatus Aminicenantes bacterium]|nr:redoxin domain-containing protein [Candidatus Aminicenantes bacterium]
MKKNRLSVLILFFLFSAGFILSAGVENQAEDKVVSCIPEEPKWGDTLQITYDTFNENALLKPGESVYISYMFYKEEIPESRCVKMEKKGNIFSAEIPVEEGASFFNMYFISLDNWDKNARISLAVRTKDGIPAKGANQYSMAYKAAYGDYLQFFEKERELYPDNYGVFRTKWFMMGAIDKDALLPTVNKDMDYLKTLEEKSPSLLYALCCGYMKLGEEELARNIIASMVEKYPGSYYTGRAFSDYEYFVFSEQVKGEGPEKVKAMKITFFDNNPHSKYARERLISLAGDKQVDLNIIEKVYKSWVEEYPDNPHPHYNMARAYLTHGRNLKQAKDLIQKAIFLILKGKLRLYDDISGGITQMFIPEYLKVSSNIAFELGETGRALADLMAAQSLQKEVRPEYKEAEAKIWKSLEAYGRAEKALLEAFQLGAAGAKAELKSLYEKRYEKGTGFEEYLKAAMDAVTPASKKAKEPAPDFEVTSLDGQKLHLADLKGKVVVLNFWFIGCAPCRVEIPGLNKLTEEFKDEKVVFIAFAMDPAEALEKYLKDHPFTYKIIPDASKTASIYKVEAFPTHVIIDKQGKIAYRLVGGSPDRHEQLRPLIKNLMR